MNRVVWLNGEFVDALSAALGIDDPGVRYGEGLFETMRAHSGVVPWLDRHLERLARSTAQLGLAPTPPTDRVRRAVLAVAGRLPTGDARIRVTTTPGPTLLVEGEPVRIPTDAAATAVTIRGGWRPDRALAEHKTLSFLEWRQSQRIALARGADTALLLDTAGRLGEASTANVFCVTGERLVTAPARGLLPGVTRGVILEIADAREAHLDEDVWRAADEMFLTSAVRGVVPLTAIDGNPVGTGSRPVTDRIRTAIARHLTGRTD